MISCKEVVWSKQDFSKLKKMKKKLKLWEPDMISVLI